MGGHAARDRLTICGEACLGVDRALITGKVARTDV